MCQIKKKMYINYLTINVSQPYFLLTEPSLLVADILLSTTFFLSLRAVTSLEMPIVS